MQLTLSAPRVLLATHAVDFRKSINGLCEVVLSTFDLTPQDSIFIFHNQSKNKLKILVWHGNGFVLIYKRLEQGRFAIPKDAGKTLSLNEKQLSWLLAGLDWHTMSHFKELSYDDCF